MIITKCTNCGREFEDDNELEMFKEDGEPGENEENFLGCPNCKTDEFLMDTDEYLAYKKKTTQLESNGFTKDDGEDILYYKEVNKTTFEFAMYVQEKWVEATILLECYTEEDLKNYIPEEIKKKI